MILTSSLKLWKTNLLEKAAVDRANIPVPKENEIRYIAILFGAKIKKAIRNKPPK